ncbi:8105_t:CDS:2 [Acaulospora morrowiae]|uniref:8105_t:CDS:1 n=1 Tax=Acaulospora morrowiae TaxID=94023 RepID=A0A9N8Z2X3_9GLOM|nr:8105_t:CDS:2 [Acaulospora morrowiae]
MARKIRKIELVSIVVPIRAPIQEPIQISAQEPIQVPVQTLVIQTSKSTDPNSRRTDPDAHDPRPLTKEEEQEFAEFFDEPEIKTECQVKKSSRILQPENKPTKNQVIDSPKAGSGPKTQAYRDRKNEQAKNISLEIDQTNEEFECLIFREQNMGPAVKRRAVVVHNAKVSKFHPDNGSDIRKILESQRKPFRELLEKKFDKRGQFKFSLCSPISSRRTRRKI